MGNLVSSSFGPGIKISRSVDGRQIIYQPMNCDCQFIDPSPSKAKFFRNFIMLAGHCFPVIEVDRSSFLSLKVFRVVISRTVEILGAACFAKASIEFLAFESGSRLREVGENAFAFVRNLRVLFVPEYVHCASGHESSEIAQLRKIAQLHFRYEIEWND
jgi:hypothetical protein